jgi:2,5-diamino-6-(ribosylamino)-4(3H)-pyrimidinone 5'-phosphate reductase
MVDKLILHNSMSLDGSLTQFTPHMSFHYQIAGEYNPEAHLIGSNTIKVGIDLYGNGVSPEEPRDFQKRAREAVDYDYKGR